MPTGLQRDGLKAAEVFAIIRLYEKYLKEDGEDSDVAYKLACKGDQAYPMVGISPEVFQRWKPDIIAHTKGEDTPLKSLLAAAVEPAMGKHVTDPALMRRMTAMGEELDARKADHGRVLKEAEELRTRTAAMAEELEKDKAANANLVKRVAELEAENAKARAAALGEEKPDPKKAK